MSSTSIAFTKRQVVISCIIKIITVISSIVGIILTARPELNTELGCSVIFMYFTIQSNILISLICLIGLFMLIKNKNVTSTWLVFKFVGTIAITLTGFGFSFILAPAFGKGAWNVQNLLTHAIVPVMAIIDFFVITCSTRLGYKNIIYVIIPPVLYVIYAGIGYLNGWKFSGGLNYPYFFLNWGSQAGLFGFSDELPFIGTCWWILILLSFLMIVGFVYLVISNSIYKVKKLKPEN